MSGGSGHDPRPPESRYLRLGDPLLAERLAHLPDPPPGLHVRSSVTGDVLRGLRTGPVVAVVGTRRASRAGLGFARALASGLAVRGAIVVSGLALGIDAAAHEGALAAGGATVAVLASGVDQPSPVRNARLAGDIVRTGALVSEYPVGTMPARWRFPARNRLIAGLSQAVVVVEAPERSGALITTDMALDMGRAVLAVPGAPWSRNARGANGLIRAGAAVCESVDDVVGELPGVGWADMPPGGGSSSAPERDSSAGRLLAALRPEPLRPDEIAERLARPVADVMADLATLELDGHVEPGEGDAYRRVERG